MSGLEEIKIKWAGSVDGSIVDGPAIRYTLFVQGCPHACPGCQNPETHDFSGGKWVTAQQLFDDIMSSPLTRGVTFSGGEPMCQAAALAKLARAVKTAGKETAAYTGFTFEQLLAKNDEAITEFLSYLDVLVDGRFELNQKTLAIPFMGSRNQRIINVAHSLAAGKVVLEDSERWHPKKY